MSEIPFGLLGEIAKGKRGVSYKPEDIVQGTDQKHYRLLTAGNIQDGITTTESYTKVPDKCVSQEQLISPDDILVCMSNGSKRLVGKSSRLRSADSKQYCVGAFCSTFAQTGNADPEFVFQIFQSEIFRRQVSDALEGSAINNLKNSTIENFQVPLPPLPEQKKIAEILSGIDQVLLRKKNAYEKSLTIEKATLNEAISRLMNPSKEDITRSIGDVCEKIFVGIASSTTHAYTDEKGVPMLRNQNIKSGVIDYEEMVYITREFAYEQRGKQLQEGDVITARTGYPGTSAVVPKRFENCHSFTTLISRVNKQIILPQYYALYLNSPQGRAQVSQMQAGGAQENLNVGALVRMVMPVPDLDTQNDLVDLASALTRISVTMASSIRKVETMKIAIASDLLSGRKRVSV